MASRESDWEGVRLHVVTGKGGTGKTTVAAALALALAGEVPQGDVDRARGTHLDTRTAVADVGREEVAGNRFDVARIAAEQPRRDFLVQEGFDRHRAPEGFAQADTTIGGADLQPDQAGPVGHSVGTQTLDD